MCTHLQKVIFKRVGAICITGNVLSEDVKYTTSPSSTCKSQQVAHHTIHISVSPEYHDCLMRENRQNN